MTNEEWIKITSSHSAAIIAPAGHGKTEMITEIVARSSSKLLLLTHTNAGVDAIIKRMTKNGISTDRYKVETIASFCIKWCNAYFKTSEINQSLSPLKKEEVKKYYDQYYIGAKLLFQNTWAGNILKSTYSRIIVDEYQDCTLTHHDLMKELEQYLPITVLGDPMQGIFGFAGPLVDWNNLGFPIIDIQTYPWRWQKTNPELGKYLSSIRAQLLPTLSGNRCTLSISDNPNINIIHPDNFDMYKLIPDLQGFSSIIYITKWERQQLELCAKLGGIFQNDEKQECPELFIFSEQFDSKKQFDLALCILKFISNCCTNVTSELKSYIERLAKNSCDFSRIKKHKKIGEFLEKVCQSANYDTIYNLIICFNDISEFKMYRKELYYEMLRSIKYAKEHNDTIFNSANHIRKDMHLQRRYTKFKYLSSRTLLSKGLEFDCVIIDMNQKLSAKEFYVAMTRAMKKIYIISNTTQITF